MKRIKTSAVICAAGKGERAGFHKNKLLAPLYGAPALYHTLKKFQLPEIDEVIVTSSELDFEEICALSAPFGAKVVTGGATRTESVKNALAAITGEIVLIHDGARPFVSQNLIRECIKSVLAHGSGICAVRATDTAVYLHDETAERLERNGVLLVQTPQAFYTDEIRRAYELAGNRTYTDDSAVYGAFIAPPYWLEGEPSNRKLTYADDFFRAIPPLAAECGQRVGFGVDVHCFGKGNSVTLAGVRIDCDRGLIAHSDGDVVIHAVMDALLSAAGLKDIGHYFPDSDPSYAGADSRRLLREVVALLKTEGFVPVNLSVSVQAEKPRLAKHIDEMIAHLSEDTGVAAEKIAVAAGTCEGLGFVGEQLGIAAYCTVLLQEASSPPLR